jgi:ribonucleoside-diphosphate reductase alpha chain
MRIARHYTTEGQSPYAAIEFRTATSEIRNPDGSIVFRLESIQVPASWSQVATDIIAQKYFRKAGVPARLKRVEENTVPSWLWRSEADQAALAQLPESERFTSEIDCRQVFDRLAGTWTYWGWKGGYFSTEEDARAFFDELRFMLATQKAAPNSPQWFNTGLHWAYGIEGPSQGHYYVDPWTKELVQSATAYEHPSRTPASSSPSPTTSSTRAASWTSGCARRACSNTAPAPAPTSRACAARAKSCRAAANPPA